MTNQIPIQPFYYMSQIASILGVKCNRTAKLACKKLNIPLHLVGKRYVVFLSEIMTHSPTFYQSLLEANNIQSLSDSKDLAFSEQFRDFQRDFGTK